MKSRLIDGQVQSEEKLIENSIRPRRLQDYIGQNLAWSKWKFLLKPLAAVKMHWITY